MNENENLIFDSNSQNIANVQQPVSESTPTVAPKKSKGNKGLVIFLILVIIGLAGFIVYDKFIVNNDTKEEEKQKTEVEETTKKEETNVLSGKKFIRNKSGEDYVKFISNTEYEYKYKKSVDKTEEKKGTYTLTDEKVILDTKEELYFEEDYLIFVVEPEYDHALYYAYYDETKIDQNIKKIEDAISTYWKGEGVQSYDVSITKVEVDEINSCLKQGEKTKSVSEILSGKLVCAVDVNIYLDGYSKSECETGEGKYSKIRSGSGKGCTDNYFGKWNNYWFEVENGKYKATPGGSSIY